MLLTDLINGTYYNPFKQIVSTSAPTANNDASTGVIPLSIWINTTTKEIYDCTSASVGAAVWVRRINANNFTSAGIVSSNTIQGGTGSLKVDNVVVIANTAYNALATPNSNTAYMTV